MELHEEMMAEIKADDVEMMVEMKALREEMVAILKAADLESNAEEKEAVAEHQELSEHWRTDMGTASSHRVQPTAEETNPGRWRFPAEVGRRPRTVHSTAQRRWP
jgi:hypothetical protein